jgi:hypothetical protein
MLAMPGCRGNWVGLRFQPSHAWLQGQPEEPGRHAQGQGRRRARAAAALLQVRPHLPPRLRACWAAQGRRGEQSLEHTARGSSPLHRSRVHHCACPKQGAEHGFGTTTVPLLCMVLTFRTGKPARASSTRSQIRRSAAGASTARSAWRCRSWARSRWRSWRPGRASCSPRCPPAPGLGPPSRMLGRRMRRARSCSLVQWVCLCGTLLVCLSRQV